MTKSAHDDAKSRATRDGAMASSGAPTVCDYYCEVGVRARLVPTATSPPHLFAATFEPSVLRRVPETDVDGVPFVPEGCDVLLRARLPARDSRGGGRERNPRCHLICAHSR